MSKGLQWVADNERLLRRYALNYARRNKQVAEELWDVIIDRVPKLVEEYDEEHGDGQVTVWGKVRPSLTWYFFKYVTRHKLQHTSELLEHDATCIDNLEAIFAADEVSTICQELTVEEVELLTAKFGYGETYIDIAAARGETPKVTTRKVERALIRAREAATELALRRADAKGEREPGPSEEMPSEA